jgi:hypothetical protein
MTTVARLFAVVFAALGLSAAAPPSRVPSGVTSIRISAPAVAITAADPATVRKIVKWFDTLPHFVARRCPYSTYRPPDVHFDFRGADGSTVLRAVDRLPGNCDGSISFNGQTLAEDDFVARVSKLVGLDFDPNAKAKHNEAAAKLDEAMLLGRARVPAGSRPVAASQTSRAWRVHLTLAQVFAFERAHRPRGWSDTATSAGLTYSVLTSRDMTLFFPAIRGRISHRTLDFELDARRGGWTRIRIRAEDIRVVPRSPNEKVPVEVTQVVFRSHVITDHAKVAKIIHWFDVLPVLGTMIGSCTMGRGGGVAHLDFRDAYGNVLARASLSMRYGLYSDRCAPTNYSIGGHPLAPLDGGNFFSRVARLARRSPRRAET